MANYRFLVPALQHGGDSPILTLRSRSHTPEIDQSSLIALHKGTSIASALQRPIRAAISLVISADPALRGIAVGAWSNIAEIYVLRTAVRFRYAVAEVCGVVAAECVGCAWSTARSGCCGWSR